MHTTTSPPGWDAQALSAALKQLRDHGYRAQQLADLAQVSRPQVSRWSSGGHRPGYDALRRLAEALLDQESGEGMRGIVRDLCAAAGYPGIADDLTEAAAAHQPAEEMISPYSGQVWRIVRSLEKRAEDAGLSEEEEREMIERAMENAERQAEMMFDAELRRREVEDQT